MLLESSTGGRLATATKATGRTHAGLDGTGDDDPEGEDLEPLEQGRESRRDARLLLRGAAAPAPERQAWHRRRHHGQEAARAAVHLDAAAGREARRPGARRAEGEPRGPRPRSPHAQGGGPGPARLDHEAGSGSRGAAAEARRGREDALLAR